MNTWEETQKAIAKETVQSISLGLNNGSLKPKPFIEEMKKEHRYLQGEFMNLIVLYLEDCASWTESQYDGRNEFNHKAAKVMIDALNKTHL